MNNQDPTSNLTDHYQILGVSFNASEDELRRAYRSMAMQWHPDRNKSPDALPMMQKINQAWEILGNPESKAEYDRDYFLLRSILAEARRRKVEEERLERERREEERRRREAQQREAERLERERRVAEERRRREEAERQERERREAQQRETARKARESERRAAELHRQRQQERWRREQQETGRTAIKEDDTRARARTVFFVVGVFIIGLIVAFILNSQDDSSSPAMNTTRTVATVIPTVKSGLLKDSEVLLAMRDVLAGEGELNWSGSRSIYYWEGVVIEGRVRRVTRIDLSGRGLIGDIPENIGNLANLQVLSLEGNQLTGEIPESISNLADLERLSLQGNRLTGEIPKGIGELDNLRFLSLGGNQLTGCMPDGLRNIEYNDLYKLGLEVCTER